MIAPDHDSRTLILEAAKGLFAAQGFAATSIKDIGRASGRNSALIHYYYHTKEELYKAVLRDALDQMISGVGSAVAGEPDPEAGIRQFVRAQCAMLRSKPYLMPLMVREMVDWGAAHAEDEIHRLGATVFRGICALVERGQAAGTFRNDLDARFVAISLVAQVNWLTLARPAVGVLLGQGLGNVSDAEVDAFADHAAELVISGLRAPPRLTRKAATKRKAPKRRTTAPTV